MKIALIGYGKWGKKIFSNLKKIYFVPDWIDQNFFKANLLKYKEEVSKVFNYDNKIIITFAGNIGALQNPQIFLDTMSLLKKEGENKYKFIFIGDGIMLSSLVEKVKKLNLDNVQFLGRVKREYIPSYMNLSDILVANYLPNEYLDICIPGKIYEYAISNIGLVHLKRNDFHQCESFASRALKVI